MPGYPTTRTPIEELIPRRRHHVVTREHFAAVSADAPVIDATLFWADAVRAIDRELQDPYDR